MNDQILLDNYLLLLKSNCEVYVHGTLESSNEKVRKVLKSSLDDTMSMQNDTYQEMTNYGWYQVNNIDSKTIKKTLDKVNNN